MTVRIGSANPFHDVDELFEAQQRLLASRLSRRFPPEEYDSRKLLWEHGFMPKQARAYDFERFGHQAFLSDLQRAMTRIINGRLVYTLTDKLLYPVLFGPLPSARVLAFSEGNRVSLYSPSSLLDDFKGDVFLKPTLGTEGRNVARWTISGGQATRGEEEVSVSALLERMAAEGEPYILTEAVPLHPALAAFYPASVNTVRVLMMRDPQTQKGFIAGAALRVGTAQSAGLDSFNQGGLSFWITVESGLLGDGAKGSELRRHVSHPETGVRISGERVPFWPETVELVHAAFERIRALNYVGWDVVVSPQGPVMLEANSFSGVMTMQVHRPLLLDERVRRFYDHHGILAFRPTMPFPVAPPAGPRT